MILDYAGLDAIIGREPGKRRPERISAAYFCLVQFFIHRIVYRIKDARITYLLVVRSLTFQAVRKCGRIGSSER